MSDHVAVMNNGRFEQVGTAAGALLPSSHRLRRRLRRGGQSLARPRRTDRGCNRVLRHRFGMDVACGRGTRAVAGLRRRGLRAARSHRDKPLVRLGRRESLQRHGREHPFQRRQQRGPRPRRRFAAVDGGSAPERRARRPRRRRASRARLGRHPVALLLGGGAMTDAGKDGRRLALILLLTPVVLWLGLLILLPHVEMLTISLRERVSPQVYKFSLKHYIAFFTEPLYWNTFARTAFYALLVTVLTLIIAFPVAYYIAKTRPRPRQERAVHPLPAAVLGQRAGAHAGLDDPAARDRNRQPDPANRRPQCRADRVPLQRRHHDHRPRLHVAAVHGRAARHHARRARRFAGGSGLRPRRQLADRAARDHHPLRHARHRRGLHRRVHADARQLRRRRRCSAARAACGSPSRSTSSSSPGSIGSKDRPSASCCWRCRRSSSGSG